LGGAEKGFIMNEDQKDQRSRVQTLTTSKFFFSNMWQFTYSGRHFHMKINNWALPKKIQKKKKEKKPMTSAHKCN
jgi:hypothetical protein